MWEELRLVMPMGKLTQLRLAISSRGVQIGVAVLSRNKLVEGRKNRRGVQVVSCLSLCLSICLSEYDRIDLLSRD